MVDFKLTIADPKSGKSYQTIVNEPDSRTLVGKKIRDKVNGESFNLPGYEFEITGGSDSSGFPMRNDIRGTGRKKILAVGGVGIKKKKKSMKQRETVCGNTIHANISQINLKVVKEGGKKLAEVFGSKEGEKKKEEKAPEKEAKKEKPKEEATKKEEEKKTEQKEEKKEEAKPEVKEEVKKLSSESEKGLEKAKTFPKEEKK